MAAEYIVMALMKTATIYGFGESYCGDIGKAVPCDHRAITASGEPFDPKKPTAAIPMPAKRIMRPTVIWLKTVTGECVAIRLNDKKNARYIGNGGLDLTPAAVSVLGHDAHKAWSGKVEACVGTDETFSEK
jgi:hypothetical protein